MARKRAKRYMHLGEMGLGESFEERGWQTVARESVEKGVWVKVLERDKEERRREHG